MDCEVILQPKTATRGEKMLRAMVDAARHAGISIHLGNEWQGRSKWLMSYGLGHVGRRLWIDEHLRRGGHLIGWDLGYWGRELRGNFSMRLTIDADHPHRLIRPMPPERFDRSGITLRNDAKPDGPIVLVGHGRKQRRFIGSGGPDWETKKLAELQARFPDKKILYRPKIPGETLRGCKSATGTIEQAIRGASLVVCSHSNVAVDACIAGIPVECEDGAAFALYRDNSAPDAAQRLEFLRSVAWWQWTPQESLQAWNHIIGVLS